MWYKLEEKNMPRFHSVANFEPGMFRRFIAKNGFNRYSLPGAQDYARYLKTGIDTAGFPHIITECPPGWDHARSFKNTKTGVVCLTYQPYLNPAEITPAVQRWAHERGLEVEVYNPSFSWYYPGSTCLVIIHLPSTKVLLK